MAVESFKGRMAHTLAGRWRYVIFFQFMQISVKRPYLSKWKPLNFDNIRDTRSTDWVCRRVGACGGLGGLEGGMVAARAHAWVDCWASAHQNRRSVSRTIITRQNGLSRPHIVYFLPRSAAWGKTAYLQSKSRANSTFSRQRPRVSVFWRFSGRRGDAADAIPSNRNSSHEPPPLLPVFTRPLLKPAIIYLCRIKRQKLLRPVMRLHLRE